MAIEDLLRVWPPPATPIAPGTPERWASAEARLGFRFPVDFKDFIRAYGSGWIAGNLAIFNPMHTPWEDAPDLTVILISYNTLFEHVNNARLPLYLRCHRWAGWLASVADALAAFDDSYTQGQVAPGVPWVPENYPYPSWPPLGGLIPWAVTEYGAALFWLTRGEPDAWPVVYGHPHEEPEVLLPGTMTEVLVGWLRGEKRLSPYPIDAGRRDRRPYFFTQTLEEVHRIEESLEKGTSL